ncbi:hypothetical protein [Prochlorococcus marinus]|uniref:hypothetical protein n=1 Tax=Prochlorococcus marinus TaxID=1219 RepID=UPI0022B358F8|nr:hypothetical protein [Prochlorococcus marinus]
MNKRTREIYEEIFRNNPKRDYLILGSSDSLCSIAPSKVNPKLNIFNLSIDGTSPSYNEELYNKYLLNKVLADNLIYGISPASFIHRERKIAIDERFVGYRGNYLKNTIGFISRLRILNVRSILEKVIASSKRINSQNISGPDFSKYDNGYLPCSTKGDFLYKLNNDIPEINHDEKESLRRLLIKVKSNGYKTIILSLPTPYNYYKKEDLDHFHNDLMSLANDVGAILVRGDNIHKKFLQDKENFSDNVHQTEKGSFSFSKILNKLLKENSVN